jgi:hypothetical protein
MNTEERKLTLLDTKVMFNFMGNDKTFSLLSSNIHERDKQILQMKWKHCMGNKDIGEHFGITPARVHDIYERGARQFKKNIAKAIDEYEHMNKFFNEIEDLKYENGELKKENEMFKRRFDALTAEDKMFCGQVDVLKERIIEFDFDVRAMNALRSVDVNTMEELIQFSRNDLMRFRNIGKKSVDKIEELLKKYNLKLNDKSRYKQWLKKIA